MPPDPHIEIEFEFNFTDNTILETDGYFADVKELVESEFPHPETWNINSALTIDSRLGVARFDLSFRNDGKIYIRGYDPSVGGIYYNHDLSALSSWVQDRGWNVPEPIASLVKTNIEFWKHYWETLLIDSSYLDEVFGERKTMRPEDFLGEK
jgi:hypothetical protein